MRILHTLPVLLAAVLSFSAQAAESFALPGHGALQLEVPVGWRSQVRSPRPDLPPTIRLAPQQGRVFEILLTPIWPMNGKGAANEEALRGLVAAGIKGAQPRAVETELTVREVPGMPGTGYYFAATDREPEPNGYTHMTQGAARVGELTVTFTILTNSGQRDVVDAALGMIAGAEQAAR
jgi:hypothetical protein